VHGAPQHSHFVKIIDKSKRAYSISLDSTKAFELTLKKPRTSCKYRCQRLRSVFYSLWILAFKHHGKPPSKNHLYSIFFVFSLLLSVDVLLLVTMMFHLFQPRENLNTFGVPFLWIYPGIAVLAPLVGILASVFGSPKTFKLHSSLNASCAMVNYPATLLIQIGHQEDPYYIAVVLLLWLNKFIISFFGAKVRQHLLNPGFTKNQAKLEQRFRNLVSAKAESLTRGIEKSVAAKEELKRNQFISDELRKSTDSGEALGDSSDDDDDNSFGIISAKQLKDKESGVDSAKESVF